MATDCMISSTFNKVSTYIDLTTVTGRYFQYGYVLTGKSVKCVERSHPFFNTHGYHGGKNNWRGMMGLAGWLFPSDSMAKILYETLPDVTTHCDG